MKIAIPKERRQHECRVAATPDTVKKYCGLGFEVAVEAAAGVASNITDQAYVDAGAAVYEDPAAVLANADIVLKVQRPLSDNDLDELALYPQGAIVIGILAPYADPDALQRYAAAQLTTWSLEFIPRITRAQSMDVLSSQSNLAGYRAVIEATAEYARAMPMMMTAAGTVAPARVMVLGAGVAGLQAIATARRLGAIVSATDVRPAAKEQVESLGAKFVMVAMDADAETAGGYAKEMSADYQQRQAQLIADTLPKQDIVITTALIPGKPAPVLVSADIVNKMKPGSVIVDMAVEQGGNCELSQPGEVVAVNGVKIIGHLNLPSRIAADASAMYAKNLLNLISPLVKDGKLTLDWQDEIFTAITLTRDGQIVHPNFQH